MVPTLSWKQGTWDSASATYFYSLSDSLFSYFLEKEAFAFLGRFFEARPQLLAQEQGFKSGKVSRFQRGKVRQRDP
jgi:hypothetical protein